MKTIEEPNNLKQLPFNSILKLCTQAINSFNFNCYSVTGFSGSEHFQARSLVPESLNFQNKTDVYILTQNEWIED